jgi:hypothetical protein
MTRETLKAKVKELVAALADFTDWDAETDQPNCVELEFDNIWKLAVVWEEGFQTVKVHRRLEG